MKSILLVLAASAGFTGSAFAAGGETIKCKNDSHFLVTLSVPEGSSLGTLSYGQEGALTTVEGVETSLVNGLGAATKGGDLLFVISPEGGKKVGELIVAGTTYRVLCD